MDSDYGLSMPVFCLSSYITQKHEKQTNKNTKPQNTVLNQHSPANKTSVQVWLVWEGESISAGIAAVITAFTLGCLCQREV